MKAIYILIQNLRIMPTYRLLENLNGDNYQNMISVITKAKLYLLIQILYKLKKDSQDRGGEGEELEPRGEGEGLEFCVWCILKVSALLNLMFCILSDFVVC